MLKRAVSVCDSGYAQVFPKLRQITHLSKPAPKRPFVTEFRAKIGLPTRTHITQRYIRRNKGFFQQAAVVPYSRDNAS
jgi:hypothetical protein